MVRILLVMLLAAVRMSYAQTRKAALRTIRHRQIRSDHLACEPERDLKATLTSKGQASFSGGVKIGDSGSTVNSVSSVSATLDFGAVAAHSCAEKSFAVSGAKIGDGVTLGPPDKVAGNVVWGARVSAPGSVAVRVCNVGDNTVAAGTGNYRVWLLR